jgi:hypothetical protein
VIGRGGRVAVVGFLGGIVAGAVLWSLQMQRSRRDLFNPSPVRRLAALGYLAGRGGADTQSLLVEYLRWEPHPLLRRRGRRLLARLQDTPLA